jgi:glycosyltransferase involved in cell wall biosynthesis
VRVLYVIDSLVPGGAERSLAAMAPHLVAAGVALEAATLHERPGVQAQLTAVGVPLHRLTGPGGRAGWVRRAWRLIGQRRPDLVHTTLFEADLAGRVAATLCRVPVVTSLVNVAYGPEQYACLGAVAAAKLRAAQLADGLTARPVVRFHAISAHVADVMARRLHLSGERIEVVPRGRDERDLGARDPDRRARARARLGLAAGTPLVLAAARHEHQKGLDVLLEAVPAVLQRIPAAQVAVAGRTGNQTPLLRSVCSRLGLDRTVRFLGARNDLPELLCAADVFVLPSRWEGLGSVLLEAMALEAPIVASDLPAVREVMGDGTTARLAPPCDPSALADAILATLADGVDTASRARSARDRFLANYTVDRIAERMVAFYDHALSAAR